MNKLRNKKKKGFTLIELVIVLAVLAIIALIAIPNFNKVRTDSLKKADDRTREVIERVVTMEIANENISDEENGNIVIGFTTGAPKATSTNADLIKNSIDTSLKDVNAPQQKGLKTYTVEVEDAAVKSVTVQ